MKNKTYKIKEVLKVLKGEDHLYFQPSNADLCVIGKGFDETIGWYDTFGNARPIDPTELEDEIEGRFLKVDAE